MIGAVLTELGPGVDQADVVAVSDRTISVAAGVGAPAVFEDEAATVQVRVARGGRLGWAGGHLADLAHVVRRALGSAAAGEEASLFWPAPAGLPAPVTRSLAAASIGRRELIDVARRLGERIAGPDRVVETWAEHSLGTVEVGNTRGIHAGYEVSLVAVGLDARSTRPGSPVCRLHVAGAAHPDEADLDRLAAEATTLVGAPVRDDVDLPAAVPVWFGPRAVRRLLAPVLQRLAGDDWVAGRGRWPALDARLTLADDPLAAGRPGTRPVCDDGIATRRITLIDRGRAVAGILDLRTASRAGLPATGHAWRRGFQPPRIGFSNLDMAPGTASAADLGGRSMLYVPDLDGGTAPDHGAPVFRAAAPWTYLVEGGTIGARLEGVQLSGDVEELLARVVAVGADARWIGPVRLPSLVLDGVRVTVR